MTATNNKMRFDQATMRAHMTMLGLPATPGDVADREADRRIVEVRVFDMARGVLAAGYFSSCEALEHAVKPWAMHPDVDAIFVTLNEPKPSLLARYANEMVPPTPQSRRAVKLTTTSDKDIRRRRVLLIDIDVERPSGISASDEERAKSAEVGRAVHAFLLEQGVAVESLTTMTSGNGFYILVGIDLPNDDASRDLCKTVLEVLASKFNNGDAHIDCSTFNASRIAALCGTLKGKGSDMEERPHRMVAPTRNGFLLTLTPAPVEVLKKIAALAPTPESKPVYETPARTGRANDGPFDMESWLQRFPQVQVLEGPMQRGDFTRWYVTCPFCGHGGKDAYVGVSSTGAAAFSCSHNSCKTTQNWKTLRALVGDVSAATRRAVQTIQDSATKGAFPTTDVGNAERLEARHRGDLRHSPALGWLAWDGRRFRRDESGEVFRRSVETVRAINIEASELSSAAAKENDKATRESLQRRAAQLLKWAETSEMLPRQQAMVKCAQSLAGVYVAVDDLDADPWLLNVENGTLDLRTQTLRPHRREDLISKLAPVKFDPAATAPTWEKFVQRIMPDPENRRYLQQLVGYALTGTTGEQLLPYLYGKGANGKTTFLGTILSLLGDDYSQTAPSEMLTEKKNDAIPNDVARLRGARFVATVEVEDGRRMAEGLVKNLTGGDKITARFMRGEWFEFTATHKIFLAANHKLEIRSQDHGIWRRVKLIPFTVTIPESEKDVTLPAKLARELSGVLNWALAGLADWRKSGLQEPEGVTAAIAEYREDSDGLGRFLGECCVAAPNAKVRAGALFQAYVKWCEERHERPWTETKFGRQIGERPGVVGEKSNGKWYVGIGLKADGLDGLEGNPGYSPQRNPSGEVNPEKQATRPTHPESPIPDSEVTL